MKKLFRCFVFFLQDDGIAAEFVLPVDKAQDIFPPRQGHLLYVLGKFHNGPAVIQGDFIHPVEGRIGVSRHQACAHAEDIYSRSLFFQAAYDGFIQLVGSDDFHIRQSGLVEHFPCFFAQISQVARIEAYGQQFFSFFLKLPGHRDSVGHPRTKRVVSIHQQDTMIFIQICIFPESGQFIRKALYPRMGHGAAGFQSEEQRRRHIGGVIEPSDDGRARGLQCCDAVGTTHPEIGYQRLRPGHTPDTGCLGGHQRLEIQDIQQQRLDHLCLHDVPFHTHHRLIGKDHLSLPHRVNISPKTEIRKILQKLLPETLA